MTVEALRGNDESFDPFFAQVRPHPGQIESARNIYTFLKGSKLVYRNNGSEDASSQRQDRYSIRTAAQWIGPVLEDLLLAHQQVTVEINSVTDNPLIDTDTSPARMLHGGNFQAKAITSAMEKVRQGCQSHPRMNSVQCTELTNPMQKVRQGCQSLGRMNFVQCTELMNPTTSRGLPPNLVVDEPSESFLWKGVDIMIAALQSELGFLASPVNHIQTAEMGFQALNSLALISARYTLDALQVLTQLAAAHLLALCQALDLRAMHLLFLETLSPHFTEQLEEAFLDVWPQNEQSRISQELWTQFTRRLDSSTEIDSSRRFEGVAKSLQPTIILYSPKIAETLTRLITWTDQFSSFATYLFNENRAKYVLNPDATPYLGKASTRMYTFVRRKLKIPYLQEATVTTPTVEAKEFEFGSKSRNTTAEGNVDQTSPTVGAYVTAVYESMRSGELYKVLGVCLQEVDVPSKEAEY